MQVIVIEPVETAGNVEKMTYIPKLVAVVETVHAAEIIFTENRIYKKVRINLIDFIAYFHFLNS